MYGDALRSLRRWWRCLSAEKWRAIRSRAVSLIATTEVRRARRVDKARRYGEAQPTRTAESHAGRRPPRTHRPGTWPPRPGPRPRGGAGPRPATRPGHARREGGLHRAGHDGRRAHPRPLHRGDARRGYHRDARLRIRRSREPRPGLARDDLP